jgi:hypothetical protein
MNTQEERDRLGHIPPELLTLIHERSLMLAQGTYSKGAIFVLAPGDSVAGPEQSRGCQTG